MLENLKKYRVLLASKSPRRKELLTDLDVDFEVVTIEGVKEEYPEKIAVSKIAEYLSKLKAEAHKSIIAKNELLITADTIVVCDGKVLGKPESESDAKLMLQNLSGKIHVVYTGVTIMTSEKSVSFSVDTEVEFAEISDEEITYYIDKYHPIDKAGAYGIQEWIGCVAVKGICGSFYNVMGLPVHRLYKELMQF